MSVVALRHVPFEHLGLIAESLASRSIDWHYVDLQDNPEGAAEAVAADGLIVMGGPMSANDPDPYLAQEREIIVRAVESGKPVLGVCLGAQQIARAMGARVYKNSVKEIGWFPVRWTEPAARDTVFHGLTGPETVFHWHGETFELPAGAEWLAYSAGCRHQAFRLGKKVYGIQFHLEVTPAMISDWCQQDSNEGDMQEVETPIDPNHNAVRLRELSDLIFGRWAGLLSADRSRGAP